MNVKDDQSYMYNHIFYQIFFIQYDHLLNSSDLLLFFKNQVWPLRLILISVKEKQKLDAGI